MNEQLTAEQQTRIFALYLSNMSQTVWDVRDKKEMPLHGVTPFEGMIQIESDFSGDSVDWWNTSTCKLLLRPLSAITDEDAIEAVKILIEGSGLTLEESLAGMKDAGLSWGYIFKPFSDLKFATADNDVHPFVVHSCYQLLSQLGYAVPLFIAPNHPLNGKTAIELGLAIDSTTKP